MHKIILLAFLFFNLSVCHSNDKNPTKSDQLLGAWAVKSISWISDEQTVQIAQAQPGMFIFNGSHYSLMWSPKKTPRVPFVVLSKPTDDEVLAGFKSIVFNSGSYQIEGDKLVATAHVAKVPGFAGGKLFYRTAFKDDQLILSLYDEIYPDGTKPDWSGKWQTEFTLIPALTK